MLTDWLVAEIVDNIWPQSSQLAEPLLTEPGLNSGMNGVAFSQGPGKRG